MTTRARLAAVGAALAMALLPVAVAPAAAQEAAPTAPAKGKCGARWPAYPHVDTPMRGSCAILGSPGHVAHFAWSAGPGKASLQIRGFDEAGNDVWHNCGAFGGICTVPWGNNAANVEMRARALTSSTVVDVDY